MIDLTPLDVRKKKNDFSRTLRGFDPGQVEGFLDLVAERMEDLVRENATMRERTTQLTESLNGFRSREQAMNEALVSAQQLREEVRLQTQKEAELTVREARSEAERILREARRQLERELEKLQRARLQRSRFLRSYRVFLEGQLSEIASEEERVRVAREPAEATEAVAAGPESGASVEPAVKAAPSTGVEPVARLGGRASGA